MDIIKKRCSCSLDWNGHVCLYCQILYYNLSSRQEFKKRLENKICELLELPDVESVKSGLFIANEPFVNVIGTSLWQHIRRAVEIKGGDMEGFGVLTSQLLLKKRTLDVN